MRRGHRRGCGDDDDRGDGPDWPAGGHAGHGKPWWNGPGGRGGPWERISSEVRGRRPGWRRRIHHEMRLYYGAHLHRKIFFSFGGIILFTVLEISLINHFWGVSVAGRPWRAALLFGIPILLLWTASGRVARRMSRPIYELTQVAQKIGAGDLSARATMGGMPSGEVAVLSRAVNDMAARIAHQLAEQRELLAAVSHELRTPLARIRLLIEIAREGRLEPRTLDEIERETMEIDTLVGELLASARLEFQALTTRPLDAAEVAARALERAGLAPDLLVIRSTGGSDRRTFKIGGDGNTEGQGGQNGQGGRDDRYSSFAADPTLVARALANLIENARKHGGGLDALLVAGGQDFVLFEVSDRGPGFAPGDETRVFASFYRGQRRGDEDVPPGRPGTGTPGQSSGGAPDRPHGSGGLGLGLALVKRIAEVHGGTIAARNRPGGGATFSLRFPTARPS